MSGNVAMRHNYLVILYSYELLVSRSKRTPHLHTNDVIRQKLFSVDNFFLQHYDFQNEFVERHKTIQKDIPLILPGVRSELLPCTSNQNLFGFLAAIESFHGRLAQL